MGCAHWVGYFICCIIIKLQIYKATADYESAKKWYQDGLSSMTDKDKKLNSHHSYSVFTIKKMVFYFDSLCWFATVLLIHGGH